MTTEANAAHAFAEMVRRTSARIATLCATGQAQKAGELALSLCDQSADRKKEIEMQADQAAGNYDLAALATMPMMAPETDDEG